MRVRVAEIKAAGPGGLVVAFSPGPDWCEQAFAGTDARPEGGVAAGDVRLDEVDGHILVRGRIAATAMMDCVRCLAPVNVSVESDFTARLVPEHTERQAEPVERELSAEDLDVSYYQGDEVDLGGLAREMLLLELPPYPVCKDECKGLCSRCGTNLNDGPCDCSPETDSAFAALQDLTTEG